MVGATAANAMAISMRTCHSERQRTRERKTGTPTAARFLTFLSQFAQLLHLLDLLLAFLPLKLLQPHLHGRRVDGKAGARGDPVVVLLHCIGKPSRIAHEHVQRAHSMRGSERNR